MKKMVKSLREKNGKKAGGQVGHKGREMERVVNPDEVVVAGVEECGHCGEDLRGEKVRRVEKRQVVEVPEVGRIKEEIREAAVGDFDETGLRVMKALRWLHVAGTEEAESIIIVQIVKKLIRVCSQ